MTSEGYVKPQRRVCSSKCCNGGGSKEENKCSRRLMENVDCRRTGGLGQKSEREGVGVVAEETV